MKRTTLVIGCVLCLCLCAVAVTPAMAKNVISPQADKLADHKLDTGMSGKGALKNADEQLMNSTSAATNAFRMQQFNDSVAWGKGLIAEVNASGYDTSKAEAVLAQLIGQEDTLRGALESGKQGQMSSVMAKNNALTKQLRMSLNNCIRTNGIGNETCIENATCTENRTMEMNRLRENCTTIDAKYLELRYNERLMYGGEIVDIFNASGYDTTTAGEQLGIIGGNNQTFMNATDDGDLPAINAVVNENKKAWNTGKRSLWDQIRAIFFGETASEDVSVPSGDSETGEEA
jgi:Spy/CpxP family protein refolding chaperone